MKRALATLLLLPALAGATPRVAVIQSDDLAAYTAPSPAFIDALGESALVVNLHGRANDAEAVAVRLRRDDPDVIFALGAKAAWIATRRLPGTPLVYASVLDPARYGVQTAQSTGVRATVSPGIYLSQLTSFFPEIRRIAVLRGPSAPEERLAAMRDAAELVGVELVVMPVADGRGARQALPDLAQRADALWLQPDRELLDSTTFRFLAQETRRRQIPLLVETENMVAAGALFAVVPDPAGVGAQSAEIARRLLEGAAPAVVPPQDPVATRVVLNLRTARQAEIEVDPLLLDFVDVVIE